MPKTIRIRNTDSEMDSVRVFLEENLKLGSREKEMTCLLICATHDARVYQRFVRGIESGFKVAIVQKLQMLSMKYYSETPSGKVFSKLASDVQFIKMLMCEQMQTVLFEVSSFQMSAIPVKDRMTYKTPRSSLN